MTVETRKKKKTKTVLIVDDDAEYLNFLCIAIGTEYPVVSVTSGEEAIRVARAKKPDVIVMDVIMPGGRDGFSTFCELRNDSRTSDIPVIILSSVNKVTGLQFETGNMKQQLGHAPAAFLEKPVPSEKLLAEIRKALGDGPA